MMITRLEKTSRPEHVIFLSMITSFFAAGVVFAQNAERSEGKHVLLISGQLNIARFKPKKWFTLGIRKAGGAGNVNSCFEGEGGQLTLKWFKNWKESKDAADREAGQRYDVLSEKANASNSGIKIYSPCFFF